jgi:hypothetical protein
MTTLKDITYTHGFTLSKVLYGDDTLQVAYKKTAPTREAHLYIEGDGYAWKNRHEPSNDPTPMNPVAMRLAAADPHPLGHLYRASLPVRASRTMRHDKHTLDITSFFQ